MKFKEYKTESRNEIGKKKKLMLKKFVLKLLENRMF